MIAKYTPAAIDLQPGDTFAEIVGGWEQMRGAATVATFLRKNMTRTELTAAFFINSAVPFAFYREESMPGINVAMTAVNENQSTGAVTITYSSGTITEYPSWADVGDAGAAIDTDTAFAEKLLALKAFRSSPDGSNKTTQIGASVSCNGLADNPVVYTEPDA